ncbi:P52K-like protein [Mya arenaria]|uniref:P52K-like protein n=1 Tax=Mya arenaria TaxID=6604 RepID=A0ABY7F9U4_MYAAR|nr:P52K-like protein [Mya arenaria]
MLLIREREPERNFVYPPKLYKDKRSKSGQMKRYCNGEWFKRFKFISYSKQSDGYMPSKGEKLITEPFSNWKDATSTNTASRIDVTLTCDNQAKVNQNKKILASILDCLVFCGRQGIALRSHRDDETDRASSMNMGNFKKILQLRVRAGDKVLEKHLKTCAKNATYTSKTSQNQLLWCVKKHMQDKIVAEIKGQAIGPYFGIQADEVTDSINWEQLGLIVRYCSPEGKPVERFLEFIACSEITGEAFCDNIIQSLTEVGLDTQLCRSQTMDGAGNMAGKNAGCAARFTRHSPRALYHYCSSHDLNLVLCKSCQVKEVHIMLDTLKQLGIFFKYSPKRSRRFEEAIEELFCETRWVEKHTCLDDFEQMYEALILCLDAIATQERRWDSNTVVEANGL